MANSKKFQALKRRLAQLEIELLPPVNPTGSYTLNEQDHIRAFRILTHAEIEYYLEDIASEIVKKAYTRYTSTRRTNRILKAVAQSFCRDHEPTSGRDFFDHGVKKFQEVLKKNHGIMEKNICSLFLSIGVDRALLDIAWLNTMSSFGAKRGEVAHTSFRVGSVLDPVTEKNLINQLITGLDQFDQDLISIRRSA